MKSLISALALAFSANAFAYAPMPSSVSKVFSYSCEKRFFEGEGVYPDRVSCVPYQHLGFYGMKFSYHLFQTDRGASNFQQQGRSSYFPGSVCGLPQLDRYTCEASPRAEFGLSELPEGIYQARVNMIANPEGQGGTFGYAALPDRVTGECPDGLQLSSVFAARITNEYRFPLPTNIPLEGGADDYKIMPVYQGETTREITSTPARTGCDGRGYCRWPDGRAQVSFVTRYVPVGNRFCVIPVNRLVN